MIEYICEFEEGEFMAVKGEPKLKKELIRCKDCKHYGKNSGLYECNCFMANWFKRYQHDDDYCSRAERKEEHERINCEG